MSPNRNRRASGTAFIEIRPGDEHEAIKALIDAGIWCRIGDFSPTERKTLKLLGAGMNDYEIGAALNISHKTANALVQRARVKIGARTRAETAVYAVRMGLDEATL